MLQCNTAPEGPGKVRSLHVPELPGSPIFAHARTYGVANPEQEILRLPEAVEPSFALTEPKLTLANVPLQLCAAALPLPSTSHSNPSRIGNHTHFARLGLGPT